MHHRSLCGKCGLSSNVMALITSDTGQSGHTGREAPEVRTLLLPCAFAAFVAKTLPSPCVSTTCVAKTVPFLVVLRYKYILEFLAGEPCTQNHPRNTAPLPASASEPQGKAVFQRRKALSENSQPVFSCGLTAARESGIAGDRHQEDEATHQTVRTGLGLVHLLLPRFLVHDIESFIGT